ncbi:DUF3488 and transglutaminase-like domain-containing protein [Agromyces humatus]|uniref:Transglutaminase-like domain-containing protein n=1 Tax=Agromyces humatus TaxID=279573 RepID=A0ABN2K4W9_9MICO|nr:transglutaminase domain-containing protein [Agromyces humatus]
MIARAPAGADRFAPTAVTVVLVVAMLGAAMIPWWPIYESPAFFVAAGAAIVLGSAIGVVGAWRRWPAWAVVAGVAATYLVVGVPVAVPDRAVLGVLPTPAGLLELVTGAALSWKQLVTIAVPVGSYQALLVPPFLLGLACATAAVTIALRSRHPAAAVIPPAVLLLAGIALGVVHTGIALQAGLVFLVTVVAWLVRVAIAKRRAITRGRRVDGAVADARRVFGASALIAVALIGATAASLALPGPQRNVVRAELEPPFEPHEHDSPLAGFRAAFREEVADETMLEVTGLPPGAGLRIAALDTYDGVVYTVGGRDGNTLSGRFARVPYRLDQSDAIGTTVDIAVDVEGYDEVWVPGIGQLERITFEGRDAVARTDAYYYNDVTGTGATQHGLRSGESYEATSTVPVPMPVPDLAELQPGTSVLPATPDLPEELESLLERWAPASGDQGLRLSQVIAGFHEHGYVSHGLDDEEFSRSGHSLDRLSELATKQPMLGDGEQYAVAAALMARRIGFPARVVVGYMQPEKPTDDAAGVTRFRSADRQAWIEVQDDDGAWVAVDPNPPPGPVPPPEATEPNIVSRPQSALPPPAERTPVDDYDADPDAAPDDGDGAGDEWLAVLLGVLEIAGFVILGLAVLVSPFLAIIVAKLRRRRLRRRAPTAVERIEGGWDEFADIASDYGYAISPTATRAEQAATVGGLGPLVLASVVDRAVFAPNGPGDDDDHRVWHTVDDLAQRLSESRSTRDRLRAAVSLSSLGGYAVTRRGGRT